MDIKEVFARLHYIRNLQRFGDFKTASLESKDLCIQINKVLPGKLSLFIADSEITGRIDFRTKTVEVL